MNKIPLFKMVKTISSIKILTNKIIKIRYIHLINIQSKENKYIQLYLQIIVINHKGKISQMFLNIAIIIHYIIMIKKYMIKDKVLKIIKISLLI